ncbi:MAG: response regulator transcription factor [Woeseiaceae bacterium]|nr:response regulator transcription factor [Woeseiaceae bacterium]
MTTAKLLLIDDDRELGEMLTEYLEAEHLDVAHQLSGEDGIEALKDGGYQLVILDIMLPGMNGLDVLKEIRTVSNVPTIMLTAKGDDIDRIVGLELGADDYLSKPFNPRELLARIKAILRRGTAEATPSQSLQAGEVSIDLKAQRVTAGKTSLKLTGSEFDLLVCLAESPGTVLSKDELTQRALGRKHMPYDRSLDTHMSNLRKKLADAGVTSPTIQSRRGVGYSLLVDD